MFDASRERSERTDIPKLSSTIKAWIGVALVGLLIFSILLATAGFVASYGAREKAAAFASEGRSVIGAVTSRYMRSGDEAYWTRTFHGDNQAYWVDVCFKTQDSGSQCGAISLPARIYESLRVGSPLRVTYVSWRPDWFYVGDDVPDDPESDTFMRIFQYCTITALLLIIVIAAMVFWNHDDFMTGHVAGKSRTDDVVFRFRQRYGFRNGRRRA